MGVLALRIKFLILRLEEAEAVQFLRIKNVDFSGGAVDSAFPKG